MSIGIWEPPKPGDRKDGVSKQLLLELVQSLDAQEGKVTLDDSQAEAHRWLMKSEAPAFVVAQSLDDTTLVDLVHFFTLAEMQLSGWDAGPQNPAIYLARILRGRGAFPPELRKWIKAHTDNRYLPYGSAL